MLLKHNIFFLFLVAFISFQVYVFISINPVYEDAIITYRYIDNFRSHLSLVYNLNERVLGFTCPLYGLINGILGLVFTNVSTTTISKIINICADIASFVGLYLIVKRYSSLKIIPLMIFTSLTIPGISSIVLGGFEYSLIIALAVWSIWACLKEKPILFMVLINSLFATRIDTFILIACLLGLFIYINANRPRTFFIRPFLIGLSLLAITIGSLTAYYGNFIPHSIIAKNVAYLKYASGINVHEAIMNMATLLFNYNFFFKDILINIFLFIIVISILVIPFVVYRLYMEKNENSELLALLGSLFFCFIINTIFIFGVVRAATERYLIPPLLCINLFFILIYSSETINKHVLKFGKIIYSFIYVFVATVLVATIYLSVNKTVTYLTAMNKIEHELRIPVGEYIYKNSNDDSTVMMEAVGFQGYYSKRYVFDEAGLISPIVVEYRKRYGAKWWIKFVKDYKPNFIIKRSAELEENILFGSNHPLIPLEDKQWFNDNYAIVYKNEFSQKKPEYLYFGRITVLKLNNKRI